MLSFARCSFEKEEKLMAEYKLKDGNVIELRYVGYGATTPNIIQVNKKNPNEDTSVLIEKIEGFDYNYKVEFNQINDTLLKVTLIDTSSFKGNHMDWMINLNKKFKQ